MATYSPRTGATKGDKPVVRHIVKNVRNDMMVLVSTASLALCVGQVTQNNRRVRLVGGTG